ncbi:hypothetical protein [Mycolicibacterium sp. CBMA 226]|uniref:hypothetical protein n=1 Tax=Mycolicibacterium sp. CBMA 226 TaxID=2606611 RepID=UPI0012DBD0F2|nr:hypothetical protein [Mycolicibacterium sp. CBMA 226]MUL78363.1 hypothetical protein [Mycolicibacterium sp. CBMA 226]
MSASTFASFGHARTMVAAFVNIDGPTKFARRNCTRLETIPIIACVKICRNPNEVLVAPMAPGGNNSNHTTQPKPLHSARGCPN